MTACAFFALRQKVGEIDPRRRRRYAFRLTKFVH